jgi:hypothetical protein
MREPFLPDLAGLNGVPENRVPARAGPASAPRHPEIDAHKRSTFSPRDRPETVADAAECALSTLDTYRMPLVWNFFNAPIRFFADFSPEVPFTLRFKIFFEKTYF